MSPGAKPWTELESLFLQALALHREVVGPEEPRKLRLVHGLGAGYALNWQPAKAELLTVDALALCQRALPEHPDTS